MKIFKISAPLPLEEIPVEPGEQMVDESLTDDDIVELDEKFNMVRSLGGGSYGIAYLTADGKVLKITTDVQEIEAARELLNIKYAPFAEIYEIEQIKDGLYYILKEKVRPLSEEQKYIMLLIINNEPMENIDTDPMFKEKMEDYIMEVSNYTQFADTLNTGNVGVDQSGNVVCFDGRTRTGGTGWW